MSPRVLGRDSCVTDCGWKKTAVSALSSTFFEFDSFLTRRERMQIHITPAHAQPSTLSAPLGSHVSGCTVLTFHKVSAVSGAVSARGADMGHAALLHDLPTPCGWRVWVLRLALALEVWAGRGLGHVRISVESRVTVPCAVRCGCPMSRIHIRVQLPATQCTDAAVHTCALLIHLALSTIVLGGTLEQKQLPYAERSDFWQKASSLPCRPECSAQTLAHGLPNGAPPMAPPSYPRGT